MGMESQEDQLNIEAAHFKKPFLGGYIQEVYSINERGRDQCPEKVVRWASS